MIPGKIDLLWLTDVSYAIPQRLTIIPGNPRAWHYEAADDVSGDDMYPLNELEFDEVRKHNRRGRAFLAARRSMSPRSIATGASRSERVSPGSASLVDR